jgi:hypothetical protein
MFDSGKTVTVHTSLYALMMLKAAIYRNMRQSNSDPMDSLFNLLADFTMSDLSREACGKAFDRPADASIDPRATALRDFTVPEGFAMWLTVGADKVARSIEDNPAYTPGATKIICTQIAQLAFPLIDAVPSSRKHQEEILGGPEGVQIVREEALAFISSEEFVSIGHDAIRKDREAPIAPPTPEDIPDELPSDEELFGNNE